MKARMSGAGTIRIESETPTEHELLQDLGARGPYFLIWRVDKGVEFAPQISPHAEADVLKSQIVGVKHELEDARQALLKEGISVGELQDEVAGLKRQVDEETKAKHRAIAERDASRLFADDEITERAAAEKERDNLKDQLGMDPSERFTLQDKWHNEKERRQAAEKRIAGMRAFRVQADELLTKLTSLLEVALTP